MANELDKKMNARLRAGVHHPASVPRTETEPTADENFMAAIRAEGRRSWHSTTTTKKEVEDAATT